MEMRIGHGFDAHRLITGRPLRLGGVTIPHAGGLEGHSDADVVLHAIANAVLGALGAGDLGRHFPPSDARYRGADSRILLDAVMAQARARRYGIVNLDVTLVAETPRLAPHVDAMTASIAGCLEVEPARVNVKVSSPEGLGALGRSEGMVAWAVVLLRSAVVGAPASGG
jgi:2-C-methyl-D-erythritol 2,4-cyclodiphosphate synthase